MSKKHMDDPRTIDEYKAMIDAIHRHGSLASASLMTVEPKTLGISDMLGPHAQPLKAVSTARLEGMIEDFVYICTKF